MLTTYLTNFLLTYLLPVLTQLTHVPVVGAAAHHALVGTHELRVAAHRLLVGKVRGMGLWGCGAGARGLGLGVTAGGGSCALLIQTAVVLAPG